MSFHLPSSSPNPIVLSSYPRLPERLSKSQVDLISRQLGVGFTVTNMASVSGFSNPSALNRIFIALPPLPGSA